MRILILDTIHGGTVLTDSLKTAGHMVDLLDVYRHDRSHPDSVDQDSALRKNYDLLIHPVHLDPAHPLIRGQHCPAITHHEAVRWILGSQYRIKTPYPDPFIEITGARGKTTTATALASVLPGAGILHTSRGTFRYQGEECITRLSITPASLIPAISYLTEPGWFIAEISLGFTGISDLAILTSDEDYLVAGGKYNAYEMKRVSGLRCSKILVPPGVKTRHESQIDAGDLVTITGTRCSYLYQNQKGEFDNPLLALEGYQTPIILATAAALLLGFSPDGLRTFTSLPGRMKIIHENGRVILDNASTGACLKTTSDAIHLIQQISGNSPFSLVIGQEQRAVCENFPTEDIMTIIRDNVPAAVFLVEGDDRIDGDRVISGCQQSSIPITRVSTIHDGMEQARKRSEPAIVLSVKTWR